MTLVDSNARLDIFTANPVWCDWSTGQQDAASLRGPRCINDVIHAKLSVRFDRIEPVDGILAEMKLGRRPIPAPEQACCRIFSSTPRPRRKACRS